MNKKRMIFCVFAALLCVLCLPTGVRASDLVKPPTGVDADFLVLGWKDLVPNWLEVEWDPTETEGIAAYNIYEITEKEDKDVIYTKIGSVEADDPEGSSFYYVTEDIFGIHYYAVTAVMPDGTESGYSETVRGGLVYHLEVRNKKADSSSLSIEWDPPEFEEADAYEIKYCVDEYSVWRYYDEHGWDHLPAIPYEYVRGLDGNTRSYTLDGLEPDTDYVVIVQAYHNGEVIDRSDILQAKTASGPETRKTSVRVCYKNAATDETVKEEVLNGLQVGEAFTFRPRAAFLVGRTIYRYDNTNAKNVLTVKKLWSKAEKNEVTVYCLEQEKITVKRPVLKTKKKGTGKILLSWKKVACDGYELYVRKGNGKFRKRKTFNRKKKSYVFKRIPSKTYSFKLRAYRTYDGEKIYGRFSKIRKEKRQGKA